MLPLHLAFRVGAKDGVINILLRSFPDALVTQDQHGKVPYTIVGRDIRQDYSESVQLIVKHITQKITQKITISQQRSSQERTDDVEDATKGQKVSMELMERTNKELHNALSDAKIELAKFQERCRMLERIIAYKDSLPVPVTTSNSSLRFVELANTLNPKDKKRSTYQSVESSPPSRTHVNYGSEVNKSDSINWCMNYVTLAKNLDPNESVFQIANTPQLKHGSNQVSNISQEEFQHYPDKEVEDNSCMDNTKARIELTDTLNQKHREKSAYQSAESSASSRIDVNDGSEHNKSDSINWCINHATAAKSLDPNKSVFQNSNTPQLRHGSNRVSNIGQGELQVNLGNTSRDNSSKKRIELVSSLNHKGIDMAATHGRNLFPRVNTNIHSINMEVSKSQSSNASTRSSVGLNSFQTHEEPEICWNEIKDTIINGSDIAMQFKKRQTQERSKPSFFLRESTERLISIDPIGEEEKEMRVDEETTARHQDDRQRKHIANEMPYVNLNDPNLTTPESDMPYVI